jgi:hypothetical protein
MPAVTIPNVTAPKEFAASSRDRGESPMKTAIKGEGQVDAQWPSSDEMAAWEDADAETHAHVSFPRKS